jgi:hypothetical protein
MENLNCVFEALKQGMLGMRGEVCRGMFRLNNVRYAQHSQMFHDAVDVLENIGVSMSIINNYITRCLD